MLRAELITLLLVLLVSSSSPHPFLLPSKDGVIPTVRRLLSYYSGPVQTSSGSGVNNTYLKLCQTSTCQYRGTSSSCFVPTERWQKTLSCSSREIYHVKGFIGGNSVAYMYLNLRSPWTSNCSRVSLPNCQDLRHPTLSLVLFHTQYHIFDPSLSLLTLHMILVPQIS
mmetsp:Transcript_2090/g.5464  ORF Transcript_2090/g.5464 Transcript_2090/m.5464 type:complete len:168 (-) Transcript_2090:631-1134(-)